MKKGNELSPPPSNLVLFVIFVKSTKDKSLLSEKAFVPIVKFGKQELRSKIFIDVFLKEPIPISVNPVASNKSNTSKFVLSRNAPFPISFTLFGIIIFVIFVV